MSLVRQRGFTLVELLLVILIIGILLAVAAPSFLSQTGKAQDSAVQQQLAVSRKEAKAVYTSTGQTGFPGLGPGAGSVLTQLSNSEPQYNYVGDGTASDGSVTTGLAAVNTIDVTEPNSNALTFCEKSASGTFFCFAAQENGALAVPAAYHSSGSLLDGLLGVSTAQAATTTDVVYSTGSSEAAARCVLIAALGNGSLATACASFTGQYSASWSNPVAGSAGGGGTSGGQGTGADGPTNTVVPAISGTTGQGLSLTVSQGTWTGASTYSYQWQSCAGSNPATCGTPATGSGSQTASYIQAASDVGNYLRAAVTATSASGGTTTAYSALGGPVLAEGSYTEYTIPTAGAQPAYMTTGPTGQLWFTEEGTDGVSSVNTNTGAFGGFVNLGGGCATGPNQMAVGSDGNMWVADNGTGSSHNCISRITPTGAVKTAASAPNANNYPAGVASSADGTLWWAQGGYSELDTCSPSSCLSGMTRSSYSPVGYGPNGGTGPQELTVGPDGNIWATGGVANTITKMSASGASKGTVLGSYTVPTANSYPDTIASGGDGSLWFGEAYAAKIGRVTTSGTITEYALPANPSAICEGADGNIYVPEASLNKVAKVNVSTTAITQLSLASGSAPDGCSAAPDGSLWVSEGGANKLARLIP